MRGEKFVEGSQSFSRHKNSQFSCQQICTIDVGKNYTLFHFSACSDNAAGSSTEIVYSQTPMVDPTFRSLTQEQGSNPYQQQQTARKQIELPNPPEVDARPILVHRPSGDGEDVPFPLIPTDYQATPENGDQQYFIH